MTVQAEPIERRLEHEVKYLVPAAATQPLLAWVHIACRPDRVHPPASVCTVYYDTPGLALLHDKIDSDFLKTKVRLRWYEHRGVAGEALFAEAKYRIGSRREKVRHRLDVPATDAASRPLDDPAWAAWLDPLRRRTGRLPAALTPVLAVRYLRHRFDAPCGARVTIDTGIALDRVNPAWFHGRTGGGPTCAVFEYKGPHQDLPRTLASVVRFGARRGSCSKYLVAYLHAARVTL